MESTCLILIRILTYSQRWISYSEGRRCLPAEQWCCWGGDHQTLESCSSCRVSDCEPDQSGDSGSTWPRSWDSSSWSALLRGSDNTEVHARLARLSPGQYTRTRPVHFKYFWAEHKYLQTHYYCEPHHHEIKTDLNRETWKIISLTHPALAFKVVS